LDRRYGRAYYEDTDFAFEARARGYRVAVQPASRIIHWGKATTGNSENFGLIESNRLLFFEKWRRVLVSHGPPGSFDPKELDRWSQRRVLVISSGFPTPDKDSGSIDLFHLLSLLRELRCYVVFSPLSPFPRGTPPIDFEWRIDPYVTALEARGIECLIPPQTLSPRTWLRRYGTSLDLLILCRARVADRALPWAKQYAPQAKCLFYTVDLHHLREEREGIVRSRPLYLLKARDTRMRELRAIRESDFTVVLSESERAYLKRTVPDAKVFVWPLLRQTPGRLAPREGRSGVLFVGGFRHRPNVDAVDWLLREIWPIVRRLHPGMVLHIVGSEMPASIQKIALPDVQVHGHIPNLIPLYASVRLTVAPLRYGAGLKGKVAESLSYGVPCVSTSIGIEGSGLVHGVHLLVADSAEEFARSIVRLALDDNLWDQLSESGFEFARTHYSLESHRKRLQAFLDEFVPPGR
ncbi:MAG: glycosyltransferase, partial [Sandaracinaceae bacterium]|nr:glycosyltransferase [Sandaracinaceae bacterium]